MPLPSPARTEEYARKSVEYLLRLVGQAPEHRAARRLNRREPARVGTPGARVLIVSPRDWAAHVQYEAVIGHALRLRGADVSFLSCGGGLEICDRANTYESPPMPCRTCDRYTATALEAHGFERRTIRAGWELDDPGWPDLDLIPLAELGRTEIDGLPLGRISEIPIQWFLCSSDVGADPLAGVVSRAFLRSARRIATGIRAALDEVDPDTVLLLNGLFLFEGIAWAICKERNIDVVTYERAFRKETLVFHRGVPAGFYDFSTDWPGADRPLTPEESLELDQYLAARRRGGAFDQYWRPEERHVQRAGGRLAVLFTNLTWDTAVINRDSAFSGIREWIVAAVETLASRPTDQLVIRVHPSEVSLPGKSTRDSLAEFVRQRFPDLPPNVLLIEPDDPTSSYQLMAACDVGLVYTSTTGMELALTGKPVIVAGDTHYRAKGFTTDVSSPEAFKAALERALENPVSLDVDVERARRYAHFFFFRAPVPAPGVVEPLPGLARLTIEDVNDLAPGRNEAMDRICAGLLDGAGFVEV